MLYTIPGTGASITVSTCNTGTSFDTKLFVFSGACGTYTCVGGNDDAASCSVSSHGLYRYVPLPVWHDLLCTGGRLQCRHRCFRAQHYLRHAAPGPHARQPDAGYGAHRLKHNAGRHELHRRHPRDLQRGERYFRGGRPPDDLATVPNTTTGNVVVYGAGAIPSNGLVFTVTTPVPTLTRL